jgi:ammonium transporter, Amt family
MGRAGGTSVQNQPRPTIHLMKMTHRLFAWCTAAMFAVAPLEALAQETPPAAPGVAAAAPAAAPKEASVEQRLTDLEQYFQNLGVGGAGDSTWTSKIGGVPGPGHNGFMMICAALVLFMTLPGLALFYGGLVRSKNVLSVLAQCMGIAGLVTILWFVCGYSFVFADQGEAGGTAATLFSFESTHLFLQGVGGAPDTNYSYWVSSGTFSMYQLMFAIITPALIIGAIAERMKFAAVLLFITLWMFAVYFPMAHAVWGIDGLMNGVWNAAAKIKAIDFAGGTVVHMTSGWSALVLCLILGKRLGFAKEKMAPHSMVLCMVGTGMLWVGWYGFNAGSALAADGISTNAFMTTTLAAATAGFVWAIAEWIHKGRPSILGFCSGIVAGLVVITPACGFVTAKGAMIIGVLAAVIPYVAVVFVKNMVGYDDALDTFGVHGVGGTLGAIMTGILATPEANANLNTNLKDIVGNGLLGEQLKAIALTIVLSVVATAIIAFVVKFVVGLRPTPDVETAGLDIAEHGEEGYSL